MGKGSNNLRGRTSDASKPYDISNSFVKRVATRVTELLPQPSWLSRWMSPASAPDVNDFSSRSLSSTITSRPPATTRAELNLVDNVDHHIPAKKPRTNRYNSPVNQKFLRSDCYNAEDISPIAIRGEPVAGPSNAHHEFISSTPAVHAQPQSSTKVNNGDDCSETSESTSGCSSLVPQAQSTSRSLGGSKYARTLHSGINIDSLHRRRPSFSTTTFASPLRASMREKLGSSPFYSGRTMYGGSSQAYVSAIHSPQRRVGPTVKPMPTQQSLPLSSTAKRILDALEQFSTPVMDAKRMPVVVGLKRKVDSGNQRYMELNVPSTPDLLRVKRRERLQQSTSAARQTATASMPSVSPLTSTDYTIRKEESDRIKHTGKVKTKQKITDQGLAEVKLPSVVLSVDNLPKIDIAIPPPPLADLQVSCQTSTTTNNKFVFASPTVVPHSGSLVSPTNVPTLSFKFSPPISELSIKTSVSADSNKPVLSSIVPSISRTSSDNIESHQKRRRSKDDISGKLIDSNSMNNALYNLANASWKATPVTTSVALPTEIKMLECKNCNNKIESPNTLCSHCHKMQSKANKEEKLVNTTEQRECPKCKTLLISESCDCQKNKPSKTLDAIKNNVNAANTIGFGNLYKKPLGTWECPTCMIRNKNEVTKCIVCETAKPVERQEGRAKNSDTVISGFGNKFKKPSGSWECQACLITNDANILKCAACTTPKTDTKLSGLSKSESLTKTNQSGNGFENMFKKAPGSWTCEVCMITNSAEKLNCAACETLKPGAPKKSQEPTPKFSFGIPTPGTTISTDVTTTFTFGVVKSDHAVQNSSLVVPKTSSDSNSMQPPISSQTFSFGIPTTKKEESDKSNSVTSITSSKPLFQFGSASLQSNTPESKPSFGHTMSSKEDNTNNKISNSVKSAIPGMNKETDTCESAKPECSVASVSETTSVLTSTVSSSNVTSISPTFIFKPEKLLTPGSEVTSNTTPSFTFGSNAAIQSTKLSINPSSKPTTSTGFMFESKQSNYGSNVASSTTSTISASSSSNVFKLVDTKTVSSGGDTSIPSINTQSSFTVPKINNVFSFGSNTEKKDMCFGTKTTKESVVTNPSTGSLPENENKPTFGSFGVTSTATPTFGNTSSAFGNSNFASKDQPNPFVPQTSNVFGTIETTNASSTSTFSGFGQTNAFQTSTQENKPSPTPLFTFGSTQAKENPAGGFVFNPVTEKRAEAPQTFGFSSAQTNASGFGFNNAPSAPSSTFNFEPKPFGSGISPFNAASDAPAPVFGTPTSQQPTPTFGEQPNPNPVFAFGSQPVQPSQTPSNPIFEFSTNQQQTTPVAPAPSTTFVFGAAPSTPATPAFDPNIRPTFNFTQGTAPVFSAIPTVNSTSNPQPPNRKIRKAIRRSNISSVRQT